MAHGSASAFLASAKDASQDSRETERGAGKLPEEGEVPVGDGAPRPAGDRSADGADAEEQERSRERCAASVEQRALRCRWTGGGGGGGCGENPERRGEWHLRQLRLQLMYASRPKKRITSFPRFADSSLLLCWAMVGLNEPLLGFWQAPNAATQSLLTPLSDELLTSLTSNPTPTESRRHRHRRQLELHFDLLRFSGHG